MQLFPLLVGGQSACLLKVQWSLGLFGFIVAENYSPSVWFGFRTDSIGINKEWIGDSVEWADDVLLWKPDKHRVPTAKSPTTKRSRKHSNQHIREFLHFNAQKKQNSEQIIFSNHIVSGQNIKTRKLKCRVFSLSLTRCRSCVTERAPTQSTQVSDICTAAALQFERRHNDTKQPGNNKHTQRTGSSSPTVTLYSRGGGEVHNRKGRDNGGRFTHGRDTEPLYRQILLWFCL